MITLKNRKGMTRQTRDIIFICLMLAVPILHFIFFWCRINLQSIFLAFENPLTGEFGFSNFEIFFRNFANDWKNDSGGLRIAIENTFITAFIRMFITMPFGVIAAYILFKKFYGHMFFRIVFYIPGIVGVVITGTMTSYILDATGPIVKLGTALGIQWPFEVLQRGLIGNDLTARSAYFITGIWGGLVSGSGILILTGSFQKIPKDLFDSMKLDGVGMWKEFIYLIVPCSWSTIGIQWIMTFAGIWGDSSRVMMLTGGAYRTNNFGYYMFATTLRATQGEGSFNYPAAIGILLTMVVAPLTLCLRKISEIIVEPVEF